MYEESNKTVPLDAEKTLLQSPLQQPNNIDRCQATGPRKYHQSCCAIGQSRTTPDWTPLVDSTSIGVYPSSVVHLIQDDRVFPQPHSSVLPLQTPWSLFHPSRGSWSGSEDTSVRLYSLKRPPLVSVAVHLPLNAPSQPLRPLLKFLKVSWEIDSRGQTVKAEASFSMPVRDILETIRSAGKLVQAAPRHHVLRQQQWNLDLWRFRHLVLVYWHAARRKLFEFQNGIHMQWWRISIHRAGLHNAYIVWRSRSQRHQ